MRCFYFRILVLRHGDHHAVLMLNSFAGVFKPERGVGTVTELVWYLFILNYYSICSMALTERLRAMKTPPLPSPSPSDSHSPIYSLFTSVPNT